jgi:hypothetical protein
LLASHNIKKFFTNVSFHRKFLVITFEKKDDISDDVFWEVIKEKMSIKTKRCTDFIIYALPIDELKAILSYR